MGRKFKNWLPSKAWRPPVRPPAKRQSPDMKPKKRRRFVSFFDPLAAPTTARRVSTKQPIIDVYSGGGKPAALLSFGPAELLSIKHLNLSRFACRSTYRFSPGILTSRRPF
jgi:hypothetical protein